MFLQHLSRLLAFRQQPYIIFLMLGLYLGITGYGIVYVCKVYEEHRQAVMMEVSQASPQISDKFIDVVYGSNYTRQDLWIENVHSMMTRKAQAKFDQLFLPASGEIFQNGKISLVPWRVLTVPNVNSSVMQVVTLDGRGTRVSRSMTLLETSKNNMPIKEFTLDLKLRKKHGKILITDINVLDAKDGTTFEQFLLDANVVENENQFNNNLAAATFYTPRNHKAIWLPQKPGNVRLALCNNPRFTLARLELVRSYIYDCQLELAQKELTEAQRYSHGSGCERLVTDYAKSLEFLKTRNHSDIPVSPNVVISDPTNPTQKAVGSSCPDVFAK